MDRTKWEYRKLEDLTTTTNGLWTGKKPPFMNIAVVRNTNFTKHCELNMSDIAYIDVEERQFLSRKLLPGDLIIEKSGGTEKQPVGRAVLFDINDGDYSFSNFTAMLRITDKDLIIPKFLHKVLQAKYQQGVTRKMQSKTTGIHNLDFKAYKNISIPIPSLSDQQHIVAELDKLNELIALKRKQLTDLDSLAQSLFYEMFGDPVVNEKGWEVKKLKNVSLTITDGDHMPPPKSESGIPFLTISDIDKETRELDFTKTFFVPKNYYDGLKEERKAKVGDLLYTVTGSYGIPVIVKTDKPFCFQRHIALIRPKQEQLIIEFLCYWALCPTVKGEADRVATGIAQKTVGLNSIRNFDIILPPLPLQQSFAAKIAKIEAEKQRVKSSLKDLETLLASRMQYWFDN